MDKVIEDKKMHSLCKTCPTCGSNNTKKFENRCTIIPPETFPHFKCLCCGTLWGVGRPHLNRSNGKL